MTLDEAKRIGMQRCEETGETVYIYWDMTSGRYYFTEGRGRRLIAGCAIRLNEAGDFTPALFAI